MEGVCVIDINPATVIFRRKGISPIAASRVFMITPMDLGSLEICSRAGT